MADKVKFWEERVRINQDRVLSQLELFTRHVEGLESEGDLMAALTPSPGSLL